MNLTCDTDVHSDVIFTLQIITLSISLHISQIDCFNPTAKSIALVPLLDGTKSTRLNLAEKMTLKVKCKI